MKNNLIILLSHCDTSEKIEVLVKNIDLLKSKGFHILLISHIPLPPEVQKKVEYFLFDKSNPILHYPYRGFKYWHTRPYKDNQFIRLTTYESDYGWTVFNQIIKAGNFSLQLEYDHYSFINYDINLTSTLLNTLNNPQPFLCSQVKDSNNNTRFPSLVLNILNKENLTSLIPQIKLEEYVSKNQEKAIYSEAEAYWKYLISKFEYKILDELTTDQIDFGKKDLFNQNEDNDYFKFFFQKKALNLYLYNLNVDLPIKFKINGDIVLIASFPIVLNLPNIDNIGYYYDQTFYDITSQFHLSDNHLIEILDE